MVRAPAAGPRRLAGVSSDLVGRPTDGSWGVRFPYFDGELDAPLRHPLPLYEMALGAVVWGLLWVADSAWGRERRPRGALAGLGCVAYFSGRFLLGVFQEREVGQTFCTSQWLSVPFILVGAGALVRALREPLPAGFRMLEGAPSGDDAPSSAP